MSEKSKNNNTLILIIIVILLIIVGIWAGYKVGVGVGAKQASLKMQGMLKKSSNQGNIPQSYLKLDELIKSGSIQADFHTSGEIKKISGNSITVNGVDIPVSSKADITELYILPKGASQDQIKGSIGCKDKKFNLGERVIKFSDLKSGEKVDVDLELGKDGILEGTHISVIPSVPGANPTTTSETK